MERMISFCGIFFMLFVAWCLSDNKRKMNWRLIGGGLVLQFVFALLILKTAGGQAFFDTARIVVEKLISLSDEGAVFLFGKDFQEHFFAFKVLPTIIFVSSIASLLFYWGILQKIISGLAWVMYRVMGASGSESLVAAANVFCGQTEAPLLIKPYLKTMTKSEITCMMTGGMATVAGGVLAAFVGMGISAGHLLAASLMSAPAAIVIAKILRPETEVSPTLGSVSIKLESNDVNAFDAACKGAADGLKLALNVGAMLIAFIALVALANAIIGYVTGMFGYTITIQQILGYAFSPFAFFMGVPWDDCLTVGALLGEKTIINEFLAYMHLGELQKAGELSERAVVITTYALCGFANFSSIAIQIGGIGALEESRKVDFAKLGFISMIGGTLAAFMTACIAGVLI
jgi:CNT family concentrative nucleoside transporter